MPHRWSWLPIALVSVAALCAWVTGIVWHQTLGWWQVPLYLGGAIALAAAIWFRRQVTRADLDLEILRQQVTTQAAQLNEERRQFTELQKEVREQFEQQGAQLTRREEALSGRLLAFREWLEFPQPVDLSHPHDPREDRELTELLKKDRELDTVLKEETNKLYDNILANRYSRDGIFQAAALRDDFYELIGRVARIYRPDVTQPLLETNVSLIIRAAGRASVHFLVLLEELPLNVKEYSLGRLHGYLRNAVSAYRMYKSAEPYWPYVNTAYYLGRFALGANPLTLGAWWFIGALGQRGAQTVATRIINRHALALLSNVVRVIGYEVAATYGGDFRHRDANWIYAVELGELVSRFPLSRESLSHALKEIGALSLRSEYDRIFLYRCLTEHVSPRPEQYRAASLLASEERRAIAARLERFLELHVHGKAGDRIAQWKSQVEARLQAKLVVGLRPTAHAVGEQIDDAIRSLASFLLATKEREPGELPALMAPSKLLAELPEDRRTALLARLQEETPYFFEHPDLDPESDLVGKYLDDLALLHVRVRPRDERIEEALIDVALYLRRDRRQMQQIIERKYSEQFAERLSPDAPQRQAPVDAMRAALDLLESGEQVRFLYGNVSLEWPGDIAAPSVDRNKLWLLGAQKRVVLFTAEQQPRLLWRGDGDFSVEVDRRYLAPSCLVRGGKWLADRELPPPRLKIAGSLIAGLSSYFRPLVEIAQDRAAARN